MNDVIRARLEIPNFLASQKIERMTDPIKETSMVVTLDKLQTSELNPRFLVNPKYDEIKSSIRQRGLDQPPPVTRRPNDKFYTISDGGNTRLKILKELWRETKDPRFFEIHCLFKPWVSEIHSLVGHLSENELRGDYAFIEKSLGVVKAKELFEQQRATQDTHKELSLRELSELLKNSGYPISKGMIGKMQQTVEYLLPCIPNVLYAGLGRPQIEKLLALRTNAKRIWDKYRHDSVTPFDSEFEHCLSEFNLPDSNLKYEYVEEEVLGLLCRTLNIEYSIAQLEIASGKSTERHQAPINVVATPLEKENTSVESTPLPKAITSITPENTRVNSSIEQVNRSSVPEDIDEQEDSGIYSLPELPGKHALTIDNSPTPLSSVCTTRSLDLLEFDNEHDLEPINDIWRIDEIFDHIESLANPAGMTTRLVFDIARLAGIPYELIEPHATLTFAVRQPEENFESAMQHHIFSFLSFISQGSGEFLFTPELLTKTSDALMIKMLRLIRIARRISELKIGEH